MAKKGWSLNPLQNPACVHICCTLRHVGKEQVRLSTIYLTIYLSVPSFLSLLLLSTYLSVYWYLCLPSLSALTASTYWHITQSAHIDFFISMPGERPHTTILTLHTLSKGSFLFFHLSVPFLLSVLWLPSRLDVDKQNSSSVFIYLHYFDVAVFDLRRLLHWKSVSQILTSNPSSPEHHSHPLSYPSSYTLFTSPSPPILLYILHSLTISHSLTIFEPV